MNMITTHYALVAIFTFLILGLTISNAEGAAYIKFDGVDGESSDDKHKGWIEILSVSEELYRFVSDATSRSRGDVILEDIVVVKELDKSSPKLAESVATGKVFSNVNIELTEGNSDSGITYYAYELKNVMVTSYSFSGTGNDMPIEDVTLNFEEIKVTYTETDSDGKSKGKVEFTWNQEKGVVSSSDSTIKLTPEILPKVDTAVEFEAITETKEIKVPAWMKGPVGFWSEGLTSDTEFRDSIQFMIKEGFIVVPPTEVTETVPETTIPGWVKGLAGYWSQGQTSDTEFVNGLTYLISKGIIVIGN